MCLIVTLDMGSDENLLVWISGLLPWISEGTPWILHCTSSS